MTTKRSRRNHSHCQRFQIVDDVMQRISLSEVHNLSVDGDIGGNLLQEQSFCCRHERLIGERGRIGVR